MKNKYSGVVFYASIFLFIVSSGLFFDFPIVTFFAGLCSVVSAILTQRVKRFASVAMASASFLFSLMGNHH